MSTDISSILSELTTARVEKSKSKENPYKHVVVFGATTNQKLAIAEHNLILLLRSMFSTANSDHDAILQAIVKLLETKK